MADDIEPRTLANLIRQGREAAGLSVRQLAPLVGVHHSVLARIESGEVARPSAEVVQHIAEALELDAAELLAFVGVKPTLPEPRVYFRRAYGMSDDEAKEAEQIIADLRAKRHGRTSIN
ncbi:helix-turn-helix domain-containing protein [Amycolatopsis tolypomycina]|uniref:helix-turn-helix domain-containing protein n=1 Tax=Amycolatopsis tolypomycina TaxID=208445 RepID=UPI0033B5D760